MYSRPVPAAVIAGAGRPHRSGDPAPRHRRLTLGDRDLLLTVNLIHEHSHLHPTREQMVAPTVDPRRSEPARSGYADVSWSVPGVTCAACERTIENAVRPLLGVESVAVDVAAKVVTVRFRPDKADLAGVSAAIESAGYPVGAPGRST